MPRVQRLGLRSVALVYLALILVGPLAQARVQHCTLAPARGGLYCQALGDDCDVELRRSLCGAVSVTGALDGLTIAESVVDAAGAAWAIDAATLAVSVERSSVLGATRTLTLSASDSIFTDTVTVARRQQGCVRFSYLPPASLTPRRYRCQPDLATQNLTGSALGAARARLIPVFTSEDFASPAYAQLGAQCADELLTGADDGAEMGVYSLLRQPQREANLRLRLEEYLPFGLEPGIVHVT